MTQQLLVEALADPKGWTATMIPKQTSRIAEFFKTLDPDWILRVKALRQSFGGIGCWILSHTNGTVLSLDQDFYAGPDTPVRLELCWYPQRDKAPAYQGVRLLKTLVPSDFAGLSMASPKAGFDPTMLMAHIGDHGFSPAWIQANRGRQAHLIKLLLDLDPHCKAGWYTVRPVNMSDAVGPTTFVVQAFGRPAQALDPRFDEQAKACQDTTAQPFWAPPCLHWVLAKTIDSDLPVLYSSRGTSVWMPDSFHQRIHWFQKGDAAA